MKNETNQYLKIGIFQECDLISHFYLFEGSISSQITCLLG